jgi:ATP/ADP translocase
MFVSYELIKLEVPNLKRLIAIIHLTSNLLTIIFSSLSLYLNQKMRVLNKSMKLSCWLLLFISTLYLIISFYLELFLLPKLYHP